MAIFTGNSDMTQFGRKFITLIVHLCLQHVYRDAARRAGSSATADTCFKLLNRSQYCFFSDIQYVSWIYILGYAGPDRIPVG